MKLYELTSGVIAAVLIALGAYQYVNKTTVEEEPVVKESVEITKPLNVVYMWYQLDETLNADTTVQELQSGTPLTSPPPATSIDDCGREDNTGEYCAVLLEFPDDATSFSFPPGTTVKDAIDGSDAIRVARNVIGEDGDQDGYARHPEPEDPEN